MAYEPEWQWFHDLPFSYRGIVEFICEFVEKISTPEYAAWVGFYTIEVLLLVVIFKLIMKKPKQKE